MESLSKTETLSELQLYVAKTEIVRGFDRESAIQKCLMLGEEVGELFKAVRRRSGLALDPESEVGDIGDELADILNFVLAIANRFDIDLVDAFVRKEEKNNLRSWVKQ